MLAFGLYTEVHCNKFELWNRLPSTHGNPLQIVKEFNIANGEDGDHIHTSNNTHGNDPHATSDPTHMRSGVNSGT